MVGELGAGLVQLAAAASLAKVSVDLRDLFTSGDKDYLIFVAAVVGRTVEERAEATRRARNG